MINIKTYPLKTLVVTSVFGPRNYKNLTRHNGVDFRACVGTPVYAVADGQVMVAQNAPTSYGKYIVIDHNKFGSLSAHLSKYEVSVGQVVKAGQLIGYSGDTGDIDGAHLHFEIRVCEYKDFWERSLCDRTVFLRCVDPMLFINLKNLTLAEAKILVQKELNLADKTLQYIVEDYRYGDALIMKIANAIR